MSLSICLSIYIYISRYIERERNNRKRRTEREKYIFDVVKHTVIGEGVIDFRVSLFVLKPSGDTFEREEKDVQYFDEFPLGFRHLTTIVELGVGLIGFVVDEVEQETSDGFA